MEIVIRLNPFLGEPAPGRIAICSISSEGSEEKASEGRKQRTSTIDRQGVKSYSRDVKDSAMEMELWKDRRYVKVVLVSGALGVQAEPLNYCRLN
ncbi:hypothetical protein NDN08_005575 [Rhodosorus marinus]|uniref:Uncharacterized protein n=1 Tax=Rhodosorus marinus TaxID=101924 RepID=A0AAV8V205_9RHOD|nr:hypothetical protein NDN08_005575 [Rhodosorus marinus]